MTKDQFGQMLDTMAAGWTGLSYESVADYFQDDLYYSDSLHYTFLNKSDLLEFFRDDNGKPQSCKFHNAVFNEDKQLGTAEYTYEGTCRYHGTVWIELSDDKIVSWREYQHISERTWEEFWKIDERDSS